MHEVAVETLFAAFRDTGDADALAAVFDQLAPKLLLVAAHLAGGGVAEDLVQATFVDAIRQRQRWDRARPLTPWLIGLLGNHVREARRQRARKPDPARVAVREVEPATAQAEANECFAAVAACVEALPRHYRQVLSLRLVHGLELQQIAHSLDVPLGTVKVRLHRGLALLRRALPVGFTASFAALATPSLGLAAARQAVLAEAASLAAVGTASTAAIVLGGWVMKKWLLGAAVAAIAAVGWFTLDPLARGATRTAAPEAPTLIATGGPDHAAPDAVPAADSAPSTKVEPPASVRDAVATTGSLDVQVIWKSDGAPGAGVLVQASRREQRASTFLRCDAEGRVRLDELAPGPWYVSARMLEPGSAKVEVRAGGSTPLRLEVGGDMRLHVTVVGADGSPRGGAVVWRSNPYEPDEVYGMLGATDAAGTLQYRGVLLAALWARSTGSQPSALHDLPPFRPEDVPREPIHVRLVLGSDGCTLRGTVVDPQGRPAAGARVAIACDDTIRSRTKRAELLLTADARGEFACDEVPPGERNVVASVPVLAPAVVRCTTITDAPTTITLQLRTGVTLTGRVTNSDGQPMADLRVTASQRRSVLGVQTPYGAHVQTRTDADGRYRLTAIIPGDFRAEVQTEPRIEADLTGTDAAEITWNPTTKPELAIRGRVVDADDKPLANWRVTAMEAPTSRNFQSSQHPCSTDTDGRFHLRGLEDVPHRLFVFAAMDGDVYRSAAGSVARAVVDEVRPSSDPLTVRIDAAASSSGWIEGSLALPEGMRTKAELSLYPKAMQRGGFMVPQQWLEPGTTTFRIGPLPPGEYSLLCDIEGRGRLAHQGLRLAANETLRLPPFAFDAQRPCVIKLQHAGGRPAAGAQVKLKSDMMPFRETSPGTYESAPVAEGDDAALVRGADFAPASFPIVRNVSSQPIELTVRAATPVVVRFTPPTPRERWVGALSIRVADAGGTSIVSDMIQLDGGADFRWPIGLLPGTYSLDFVVHGEGKANTTAVVGTEPLQIDLQIAK